MKKMKFKITGMHCTSCAMNIDFDLEDLKGVKSSNTNYAKSESEVEFDDKNITTDQMIESIKKTGYKAQIISEKA